MDAAQVQHHTQGDRKQLGGREPGPDTSQTTQPS